MKKILFTVTVFLMIALTSCGSVKFKTTNKKTVKPFAYVLPKETEGVCGMWVATVSGIDFPSSEGLSEETLKQQIREITEKGKEYGVNTIFFQVRPCADALYPSKIFPSSAYVSGRQGVGVSFDILEYFIEKAHEKGIKLHAWINPYRITTPSVSEEHGFDLTRLAENHPARLHPETVVKHVSESDGKKHYAMYFNPALPEVRQLVCDGVAEIIDNYDVDGIHFDDYFYPYEDAKNFDDGEAFALYGKGMSRDDWRRENINLLIEQVHGICDGRVPFGVSPCGVWAKKSDETPEGTENIGNTVQSYYDIYADVLEWIENKRIDYICPQLYWQINHPSAPFYVLADWWDEVCTKYGVDLYIGIGAYRGNESGAFSNPDEIASQIAYAEQKKSCKGVVFFSYTHLKKNYADVQTSVKRACECFVGG